ncbi:MAG: T9SS type A sorting domain-containing protein [Bacteroidetes bacterium]|nr:T9SS type A sorting domain-containing protein [Bacteroidota bacterium]MBU1719132.1 T9SS type A sorting domain-containing protein [Bacteroidota bacterium]
MKKLVGILFLFVAGMSAAQSYYLSQGFSSGDTVMVSGGTFYDSGGNSGMYSAGESYSVTFCPQDTSEYLHLGFTTFDVGQGDTLIIIDGYPDQTNRVYGKFTNKFFPTQYTLTAGVGNTSGCLSVFFKSESSAAGWSADISTTTPCQTSIPSFTIQPAATQDHILFTCSRDTVNVVSSGVYPYNGLYYPQSNPSSQFILFTGDTVVKGQATHPYYFLRSGYADISLKIKDTNGCLSHGEANSMIFLSGIEAVHPATGQYNTPFLVTAGTTIDNHVQLASPPYPMFQHSKTKVILDNSTTSDTILITAGIQDSLLRANSMIRFFLEMEHSYLGDIAVRVKCPTGKTVILKESPGGGNTYLGEPVDLDASPLVAGLPYHYGFTFDPSNPYGTMVAEANSHFYSYTDVLGNSHVNQSYLPSATYLSYQAQDSLTGCPVNGNWVIQVIDNLAQDQGFFFSWGIDIDPTLLQVSTSMVEYIGTASPYATQVNDTSISLQVPFCGTYELPLTIYTRQGCAFDTIVQVYINEIAYVEEISDTTICNGGTASFTSSLTGIHFWSTGSFTNSTTVTTTFDSLVYLLVLYNGCNFWDTAFVHVSPGTPNVSMTVISGDTALQSTPANCYQWYLNGSPISGATAQEYFPDQSGVYTVVVSDDMICYGESAPYTMIFAGIGENESRVMLTITPNPATESFSIHHSGFSGKGTYRIKDSRGVLVKSGEIDFGINEETRISLSGISGGVYFTEMESPQGTYSARLVVFR